MAENRENELAMAALFKCALSTCQEMGQILKSDLSKILAIDGKPLHRLLESFPECML